METDCLELVHGQPVSIKSYRANAQLHFPKNLLYWIQKNEDHCQNRGMSAMKLLNIFRHFATITEHKLLVMSHCFQVGLFRQGLLHDLSKYSPEEFWTGVRFYQGDRSPNAAEREIMGFSRAWLHHKGRNKHHYEYWIDVSQNKEEGLVGHKMPLKYVVEMVMDRIAACKVYRGKDYTDSAAWEYYERTRKYITIHPETRALLERLLWMLKTKGEKRTFAYIRKLLRKGYY